MKKNTKTKPKSTTTIIEGDSDAIMLPAVIQERVAKPAASRSQIIEALVETRILQNAEALTEWLAEEERLHKLAFDALIANLPSLPHGKALTSVPSEQYSSQGFSDVTFSFNFKLFADEAKSAVKAYHQKRTDPNRPEQVNSWQVDNYRKRLRNEIRSKMAIKEGSNPDRLKVLLTDKTQRMAFENMLAVLDGAKIVDAEAISA